MKIYMYRVKDEYDEIVREGCVEECVDVIIGDIIPKVSTLSDRCLWDVQDFLDENYPELKYNFEYKEISIDYDNKNGLENVSDLDFLLKIREEDENFKKGGIFPKTLKNLIKNYKRF